MLHGASRELQETPEIGAVLRPLDAFAGSLAARVHASLREAILDLALPPGAPLKSPEICAVFGVSRSPVADAMARLREEGLVDILPQAGTFVSRLSMEDIREGAFLREAIELQAVEQITGHVTGAQATVLKRNLRIQAALLEDGDFAGFYEQDRALHEAILSMTGFRRIVQVADTAWVQVNRARQLVLPVPGRVAETLREHEALVAAILSGDPEAARAAMRSHLRQLMRFIVPLERAHPDLFTTSRGPR